MSGPWDFWNRYYHWSIQAEPTVADYLARFNEQIVSIQIVLRDEFTPVIKKVAQSFRDFSFTLWVIDQPRWQRPFMRFAYRIERLVLR